MDRTHEVNESVYFETAHGGSNSLKAYPSLTPLPSLALRSHVQLGDVGRSRPYADPFWLTAAFRSSIGTNTKVFDFGGGGSGVRHKFQGQGLTTI